MSDALNFDMGLYQAALPTRLRYSEVHFWFDTQDGQTRIGLTSYASRLLDEVLILEWSVKEGQTIEAFTELGLIESNKASSELYAPMGGKILAVNDEVAGRPRKIAQDPYKAWLLAFEGAPAESMDVEGYCAFLEEGWDETQRMLKGQM